MLAFWILIAAMLGILVHEAGHLVAARIFKLGVLSVDIGFGREVIARTDRWGTRWKLNLIPLGGSCSFFDRAAKPGTEPSALSDLSPQKEPSFIRQARWPI